MAKKTNGTTPGPTERPPINILPRSGLYLMPYSGKLYDLGGFDIPAEESRFVTIFRTVWGRIPRGDRRRLLQHWRNDSGRWSALLVVNGQPGSPGISLVDPGRIPAGLAASCKEPGHSLYFQGHLMFTSSEEYVAHVIAHELAHVYLYATGEAQKFKQAWADQVLARLTEAKRRGEKAHQQELRKLASDNDPAEEEATDRVAARWGFPPVEPGDRKDRPTRR